MFSSFIFSTHCMMWTLLRSASPFSLRRTSKSHQVRSSHPITAKAENNSWPDRLGPEIMAPVAGQSPESVDSLEYKLYGVLYHLGKSASSGHYPVVVLRPG